MEDIIEFEDENRDKKNSTEEANELIETSKEWVSRIDEEVERCQAGVSKVAEEFDELKRNFNNSTFKSCEELLTQTGFKYSSLDLELEPFELSLDQNFGDNFSVNNISSGYFSGFILALLAALATVGAWIYFALMKLNIPVDQIKTIESAEKDINPVLNWIGGGIISQEGNLMAGALVLGFSALIVAWVLYAFYLSFRGKKNLRIAKETYNKSAEYCMTKEECKHEIEKVDGHLRECIQEIKNFTVILNEKSATLKRIVYVEGSADTEDKEYHPYSKKVMRETEKVMQGIENLLNTAITQEGRLFSKSERALANAKAVYADYLARIYD